MSRKRLLCRVKTAFKATPQLPGPPIKLALFYGNSPVSVFSRHYSAEKQQLFPKVWGNIFGISSFCTESSRKKKVETISKFLLSLRPFLWLCGEIKFAFLFRSMLRKRRCLSLHSASRTVFRRFLCVTGQRTIELFLSAAYLLAFWGIVSSCFVAMEISTR